MYNKTAEYGKILLFYSNPVDTIPLRFEKEHKAIDQVIRETGFPPEQILRFHAVSVNDFPKLISDNEFEVLHFSGHGSKLGLYLEQEHLNNKIIVDAEQLASILETAKRPKLIVLLSCYSSETINSLNKITPFILSMVGAANDDACITFISEFYRSYFKKRSIELAYSSACSRLRYKKIDDLINPCLTRTGLEEKRSVPLIVNIEGEDSLLIDISRIDYQIDCLDISREEFLSALSRKIHIHRFVFYYPREGAILAVGSQFCEFTWNTRDDPIVCRRIIRFKADSDDALCTIWAKLILDYNQLFAQKYRVVAVPNSPTMERGLKFTIAVHYDVLKFLKEKEVSNRLRQMDPLQYKTTIAFMEANLSKADSAFGQGILGYVIESLELSLTSLHDLCDKLTKIVTESLEDEVEK